MGIELRAITKTYKVGGEPLRVLDDISLTIPDGELCAVMGPSGSGKSTLMNVLGCLDKPTSGVYSFDGEDLSALDDDMLARIRNRKIGFIFQSYNLVKRTTALDNVQLPMLYAGVPPAERRQRAAAALRVLGLRDRAHHMPNELSGGQQQRVAIARALVMRPALILADEPTGALDSRTSLELMAIFQRLNREMGITIVIVTHEQEIAAHTRRILRLHDGALIADETVRRPKIAAAALGQHAPLRLPVRMPVTLVSAHA